MTDKQIANVNVGGVPMSLDNFVQGLTNMQQSIPDTGNKPFLKLQSDGLFAYGAENIEVEEGSLWAINPLSLRHGWCCWTNNEDKSAKNELLGEVMVPFNQLIPALNTLQDYGWPWQAQSSLDLRCMSGEDEGIEVLYKSTSIGFTNAVRDLIKDLLAQIQDDPKKIVPVVMLDSDSYQHKKYGKTYVPILDVKQWVAFDSLPEPAEDPKADKDTEAPEPESKTPEVAKTNDKDDGKPANRTRQRRRRG